MASASHYDRSSPQAADRPRATGWAFAAITALLITTVFIGVTLAARSNKWWWDNLAGPNSSNFVGSDQIKKDNVGQLEVAWFYPYATSGSNPIVVDDAMYTVKGRQYFVLIANRGGGRDGARWCRCGAACRPE